MLMFPTRRGERKSNTVPDAPIGMRTLRHGYFCAYPYHARSNISDGERDPGENENPRALPHVRQTLDVLEYRLPFTAKKES